jgi:hypothetical protein
MDKKEWWKRERGMELKEWSRMDGGKNLEVD